MAYLGSVGADSGSLLTERELFSSLPELTGSWGSLKPEGGRIEFIT